MPESGRSHGGGNCNPLNYSYLENPMDRVAWWVTVHGVAKSQTQPSNWECTEVAVYVIWQTDTELIKIIKYSSDHDSAFLFFFKLANLIVFSFFLIFSLTTLHSLWNLPDLGSNPSPLQWKHRVNHWTSREGPDSASLDASIFPHRLSNEFQIS